LRFGLLAFRIPFIVVVSSLLFAGALAYLSIQHLPLSDADETEYWRYFSLAGALYALVIFLAMRSLCARLSWLKKLGVQIEAFDPELPEAEIAGSLRGRDEVALLAEKTRKMAERTASYLERTSASAASALYSESHLKEAQRMARIGSWEYHVDSGSFAMSTEMYRLLSMNTKNQNISWEQFLAFVVEEDREYVNQVVDDATANGSKFHMGYEVKTANGDVVEVHTYGKVRKKADGKVRITGVTRDVTEQNRAQQMIEKLAYFDALTNLPNRVLFKDRLSKAIDAAKRSHDKIALLFLDLDHFKLINDTLGHYIGDRLLTYVSDALNKQLRGSDTISRIGGDEFVVLLPQIREDHDAVVVAEKLLTALEGQHIIERHTLFVSTSIGIAVYPDHAQEIAELIRHADTAMYEAKQKGRNNWQLYHPDMGGQQYGQMLLEEELYEAVKTMGQFQVYYQPQFTAAERRVCGLEALIRWEHPEQGLLEPDQFIPMLESSGMIVETGYWVLEQVVSRIASCMGKGEEPLTVFINLSARQLQDSRLGEKVASVLEAYSVEPSRLGFEVSEGVLVSNVENYTSQLQRLNTLGVALAIDDYGSSYSSIPVLTQFPLKYLKIDQQLIRDLGEGNEDVRNVRAIVMMARALELQSVVEGIEEEEQEALVCELGCDVLQGYLYCRPLAPDALELFLEKLRG